MKYEPYEPTKWEQRIDSIVRAISPRAQCNRTLSRERENQFRYLTSQASPSRRNAGPSSSGETMRGSREKLQVMWNAIECVENSGLCTALMLKIATYVCGRLRWQARTGDKDVNNEYEDYMRTKLTRAIDVTGRFSLRQMALMDIKGMLVKGDIGTNIVRDGRDIYLQGIEADRIGDPFDWRISQNFVRGLLLDDNGMPYAAKVYYKDRATSLYKYDDTFEFRDQFGMPKFLFMANPINYDEYRGISVFKTAIDNADYIEKMRANELQALMWAASQSGIFHTKSGYLPEGLPFDENPPIDDNGRPISTFTVRPNQVTAVGVGEDVSMFQHDRPSPNVISMVRETVRDICVGAGVSFEFGWDKSGLNGPAVRQVSSEDARGIELWQFLMTEQKLDPVATIILGNGILNKEIQYHPNWNKWQWFFPSKSTIDVGRESAANIDEMDAGVTSGALVCAEDGQDIDEIREQRGNEIEANIEEAIAIAKTIGQKTSEQIDWREIYMVMFPKRGKGGGSGTGVADFSRHVSPRVDAPGATDDGTDLEDGGTKPTRMREPVAILSSGEWEFYDPGQARDDHGRFDDEGKGSQSPGYTHPGDNTHSPLFHKYTPQADRGGMEFFSPNTGEMDFKGAVSALHSTNQSRGRAVADDIDYSLGLKGYSHDAIGDWNDGAENSVIHEIRNPTDFDEVRYSAALKGKALNQKAVLAFQADENGKDAIHSMVIPSNDLEEIRGQFEKAGVHNRTLVPNGKETIATVFDPGNKLINNVTEVADNYGKGDKWEGTTIQTVNGRGEFVGESDTRKGAQSNYGQIINDYESRYPNREHYQQGKGSRPDNNRSKAALVPELGTHSRVGRVTASGQPASEVQPPSGADDVARYTQQIRASNEYQAVEDRYDTLEKESPNGDVGRWSQAKNSVDGKYTPARQALHEKIINKFLNPNAVAPAGTKPVATLLIGVPGAGKTTSSTPYIKGEQTYMNTDSVREELPEYQGWNSAAVHNEASSISKNILPRAVEARHNMVIDETGIQGDKMEAKVNELGARGYDVNLIHVDTPLEVTAPRVWNRFIHEKGGRFVPMDFATVTADHHPLKTYNRLKNNPFVKRWTNINNAGNKPVEIESGSR